MGILNTLAIVGCVALARRRGGLILMFATAAGIALMCQSLPTEAMHDIWNPAAGLFGFLLLIFLGWSLACGEHRLLPITVFVASFVTQTHLMYATPTAVLLAVGFGGLLLGSLKRRRVRPAGSGSQSPSPSPSRRIWPWALAALALAGLIGAVRRRWDLAAAALIGLGLCAAIGVGAASNPSATLLAETLGYTMWWGSELGLWAWLMLAWALWLGLVGLSRPPLRALRRRIRSDRRALPAWARPAAAVLASLASLGAVGAVGSAVAATAKPDSHVYEYRPIRAVAAGIERLIEPGLSIEYRLGPLDVGTQPMEPAIRFLLVRHGDRVLASGSFPRLGSYYELYHRPVQWTVYLEDGTRPQSHMTLAARVRFADPWGTDVLSAWAARAGRAPAP